MSTDERDTHFANAAKRLFEELMDTQTMLLFLYTRDNEEELETLFAHFAYDLACHVVHEAYGGTPNAITIIVADIPDLDAWPPT